MANLKELLFQNRNAKQTVAKNIFWLSISQFAGRLIRSAVIIYAARVLGAAEYGVFSYALGLAGLFTVFADIGLGVLLTKQATQEPGKASSYFATSFWIKNVLLAGTVLLIVFAAPHFSKIEQAAALLPFVALLVVFDNIRDFSFAFLRAKEKMEYEALTTVFMNVAITILGFVALHFSKTAGAVTFAYVGSAGVAFMVSVSILRKEFFEAIKNFDKKLIKPILEMAWPIALTGFLGAFMINMDIVMLGWFRSETEVGLYSAGQKIIQLLYVLPTIIASAVFPSISRAVKEGIEKNVRSIIEKSASLISLISFPIAAGGLILGRPIMNFLYGSEYDGGTLAFKILTITVLIIFYGGLFSNLILARDQQRKNAVFAGLASLANIVFNAALIPFWGIAGAAISTLLVQTLYYGLMWKTLFKISPFNVAPNIKKIIPATAIMGIFAFLMNCFSINVILNIAASMIVYFGLLFAFKESFTLEAKKIMKIFKK